MLGELLGSGAHGHVHHAVNRETGELVALKLHRPVETERGRQLVARFRREGRLLAQINDPHVVRALDHGEEDGVLFLVQEMAGGTNLHERLEAGALSRSEARAVLQQLLLALKAVHREGILHRDIKPANVIVASEPGEPIRVKLADFGIARPDRERVQRKLTATGEILGTPGFMAPEQLLGEPLDARTDLYAVGLILIQCFAGAESVKSWQRQAIGRELTGAAAPELPPSIPRRLRGVISRLAAPHRDHRPESAESVLRSLARPREPAAQQPPARAGSAAGIAIAATIAVLAIVVGALVWRQDSEPLARTAPKVRALPTSSPPAAPESKPDLGAEGDAEIPGVRISAEIAEELVGTSGGCGKEPFVRGLWDDVGTDETIMFEGATWVPRNYDPNRKYPVVTLFHADNGSGPEFLATTRFVEVAGDDAILIAPTLPQFTKMKAQPSLRDVLTWTSDRLCIDPHRIFMVTNGVGGLIADKYMCGPMLAGLALNSYRPYAGDDGRALQRLLNMHSGGGLKNPRCRPKRPIPTILFSPLDSPALPATYESPDCGKRPKKMMLDRFEQEWRTANECRKPRGRKTEQAGVTCWEWDCSSRLTSCHVPGVMGWPGSGIAADFSTPRTSDGTKCESGVLPHDFPASEKIWAFFQSLPPTSDHPRITWKPIASD